MSATGEASASTVAYRLHRTIELVSPPFDRACERVLTHPQIREVLPEYLIQTHTIIRTTVPLMEAAIERAQAMADADPVVAGVTNYLERHVEEERHHDDWLLDDLELMGVERREVLERIPSPTVAALGGSQYYWALHYHPVALLGYFAFMEGCPPTRALVDELIARTEFPREAFRTMVEHGELDPGHGQELDRTIDSLPLTRSHEIVLGLSVISTADFLTRALEEILERFGTRASAGSGSPNSGRGI